MADKFQTLEAGRETLIEATVVSVGPAASGDIVALGSDGRLDLSVLPTGIGPEVVVVVASENLGAGDFVNLWNNSGTTNVRLADASNDRPAHGWVENAFAAASLATVYIRKGVNSARSGLTNASRQFLGTAGDPTETVPALPGSVIHQYLGVAVNATTIIVDIEDEIVL